MAISMGSGEGAAPEAMSEINTTPLVDVMLVLIIVFLITVPVAIETVELTLPEMPFEPTTTKAENVQLWIRGGPGGTCEVFWGNTPVDSIELLERGQNQLEQLLEDIGGPENITEENFPEVTFAGTLRRPGAALAERSTRCSSLASRRLASFPNRGPEPRWSVADNGADTRKVRTGLWPSAWAAPKAHRWET